MLICLILEHGNRGCDKPSLKTPSFSHLLEDCPEINMACTAGQSEVLLSQRPLLQSSVERIVSTTQDVSEAETSCSRYCVVLDEYLEMSALLDPILASHTTLLCASIMDRLSKYMALENPAPEQVSDFQRLVLYPCRAIYTLAKVRGLKRYSTHLPHQVIHLRFLLSAMSFANKRFSDYNFWEIRYVVYIWSAVAIRAPFPLTSIFTDDVISTAIQVARSALTEPSRVSDVAAAFLARLLSRRDAADYRRVVVDSAVASTLDLTVSREVRAASLSILAAAFKFAHRDDLRPLIAVVMPILHKFRPNTTIEFHRLSKLAHRIALAFLPPRPASWRYSRATHRVLVNSETQFVSQETRESFGHDGTVHSDESEFVLSEEDMAAFETIIDYLFESLRHRDTVVRYSAAKGVARVAAKLPRSYACDVVNGLLDILADRDEARSDAAVHGGCLAVAELARRGLLLPNDNQFQRALNEVHGAAKYDVRRGAASVGDHVRDAACYVIWAVARAYDREYVSRFGKLIADAMVPVALFDREVNCRRAASAALQECVGRLADDVFPEGIKLITIADYFSLNDRNSVYLILSPKVAALAQGAYFPCIVEELWQRKLTHWDPAVRALSSKALARLVKLDHSNVISSKIFPKLVTSCSENVGAVVRHGVLLGLSELIHELPISVLEPHMERIRHIPVHFKEKSMFVGKTGDDLRIACCVLIRSLVTRIPQVYLDHKAGRDDAEQSLEILDRMLGSGIEELYIEASSTYKLVSHNVLATDATWHKSITKQILKGLTDSPLPELQRGFALAAGVCGESEASNDVVTLLCQSVVKSLDVEVRRNAAKSLSNIPLSSICSNLITVFRALSSGIRDYTTDERGDVGSLVREASMKSFESVIVQVYENNDQIRHIDSGLLTDHLLTILRDIVYECCGRIDRTRIVAWKSLKVVCGAFSDDQSGDLTRIRNLCKELSNAFHFRLDASEEGVTKGDEEIDFSKSENVFPAMRRALNIVEVRSTVMRGFIHTGGGTRAQMKAPCDSLETFFRGIQCSDAKAKEIESGILKPIRDQDQRLITPALTVLALLTRRGVFRDLLPDKVIHIVRTVRGCWRGRTKDVKLVMAALSALDDLVCLSIDKTGRFGFGKGSIANECVEAMAVILGGTIPRLRRVAAESMYITLALCDIDGYDGGCDPGILEAIELLLYSTWEAFSVVEARSKRNEVCRLLRIQTPIVIQKKEKRK